MRRITDGPFQDIHPFYLPDGKIGFVSTRVKSYAFCQPGAGCALHVMEADGSNIRRIHFGTLADHSLFDKYCAECHSGLDPAGGIDLSGDKTRFFNMAYDNPRVDMPNATPIPYPKNYAGPFKGFAGP